MKKFLPFLSVAIVFAACSSKPSDTEVKTIQSANQAAAKEDTAGLAQFQAWKSQNELNSAAIPQMTETPPPVKEVTVIRERVVERQTPVKKQTAPKQSIPDQTPVNTPETTENEGSGTLEDIVGKTGTGEGSGTTTAPTTTPEVAKKEGWSKAAKGAAIGGAGGAVLGAIISKKNPAVGAAIGGVLGGAVGYGIGRSKDKKDGRY